MANYVLLQFGDRLPTVGVLQGLLNRSGAGLVVDGIFGRLTREAVRDFQSRRNLAGNGTVGQQTWSRLTAAAHLPIVDCIDVFDEAVYEYYASEIRRAGGDPILIGGMCRGVVQAAKMIRDTANAAFLLRFIGHGGPGRQQVSAGKGGVGDQRAALNFSNAPYAATLQLGPAFGSYGSAELHGCKVASGSRGRDLLSNLARAWGVPVTAGLKSQHSTFRFDGPTFTAVPFGGSLSTWCATLPRFAPLSVP